MSRKLKRVNKKLKAVLWLFALIEWVSAVLAAILYFLNGSNIVLNFLILNVEIIGLVTFIFVTAVLFLKFEESTR